MGKQIVSVILPSCIALLFINCASSDNLENFARLKLANYSTWLKINNLDPSPVASGPIHVNSSDLDYKLDCYLRNHRVGGHSEHIEFSTINASLLGGWIDAWYRVTENITFYGEYKANGTVKLGNGSNVPVSAEGMWHINVESVAIAGFNIFFGALPNKSLHYAGRKLYYGINLEGEAQVSFHSLFDNEVLAENEEKIVNDFYKVFRHLDVDHPVGSLYIQYWQQVLPEATWKDIIGTEQDLNRSYSEILQSESGNVLLNEQLI